MDWNTAQSVVIEHAKTTWNSTSGLVGGIPEEVTPVRVLLTLGGLVCVWLALGILQKSASIIDGVAFTPLRAIVGAAVSVLRTIVWCIWVSVKWAGTETASVCTKFVRRMLLTCFFLAFALRFGYICATELEHVLFIEKGAVASRFCIFC